ncbi:MAG: M36 family metallopeptidase [Chitinophagaceae bacterium]|nr:M36 family metallopeptidase [Chitinophagaceae bacterium]
MKKIFLFFALMWCALLSMAQNFDVEKNAALQQVSAHRSALGLSADDLNNLTVSNAYTDRTIGIRYVYLQQTFKDIPVYNQIQVIAFKNNIPLSNAGGRIADLDKKVNVITGMPSKSAESAVMAALANKGLAPAQSIVAINTKDNGRLVEFGNLGVTRENITAQLMWFPSEDGSSIRLAWQVYFIPTTSSDYWLVKVDATNNNILNSLNLTVSCNWDDPKHVYEFGLNHNHANETIKSGFGDKLLFDYKKVAQLNNEFSNSPSLADNGVYRVIPLPYEAPSFMPGAPSSAVVNNPWTAATANAVTLKWHSTDASGTDYNYTRGNNVWAAHDRANNNSASQATSATSTTALPNLSFDFVPDYTQEPVVTSPPNQQFNITNLFYYNNIIHDVLYAYGFDEVGGNFQVNNLGRGGVGNDHVWADAQDGGGSNNANFATPADGGSGRMQMYLTTGAGIRSQRYSTDMAINSKVYQAVLPGAVHDRGEFWCAVAWEATWAIIQQAGTINSNIYWNGSSTAGNVVAMRIAIQAMKLAPCGSGFIDHRDGWLRADTLLYGGAYSCSIWEAFRKRGMGAFALQGSANSASDQTPDFTAKSQVALVAGAPTVAEGTNLTYTNTVSTCSRLAIANYLLTDTLPANANFVSATNGGVYNAGNRVVSWVVNLAALGSATYQFTVNVPIGSFPGNVVMRSSLFNDGNPSLKRFNVVQTTTPITQIVAGCPVISVQPSNTAVCVNTSASFTTTASAANPISYQWQVSTAGPGGPWVSLTNVAPYSNVTTNTLTINPAAIGLNGNYYRCNMVTSDCPAPGVNTNGALLNVVNASIGGTIAPAAVTICGTTNSGTLTLSGHTGNVVRWERSINAGGTWTPVANTTTTLNYTNITQTTWYRAVVQVPGCATANSTNSILTFQTANAISIEADRSTTICQGDPVRLTAMEGAGTQTITASGAITIPSASSGPASPYPANLTVSGLPTSGVTVQSVSLIGINHTWSGDLDIAVQSPTGTNVMLLSDVGGSADFINNTLIFNDAAPGLFTTPPAANTTGTYKPTNTVGPDNFPGGPAGVPANPTLATFTGVFNGIWKLYVYDQAAGDGGSISGGYSITFTAPSTPITTGTFLWTPAAGLNSTTTNPVAASPAVTTTYTVNHDNGAGCIRQASITITVNTRPAVTTQPANTTVCDGSVATFTAAGTGTGAAFQWQVSTNGGVTWTDLTNAAPYSGVTTGTLTINPVALSMNGYRYRMNVSGSCPPVASTNGAILTVNALPVVTVSPTGPICGGVAGINGLALTASGANTYVWAPLTGLYTNATATTPYTGTNLATVYAAPTTLTTYTVTGTATSTGCSNSASVVVNYTPPPPTVTPNPVVMCLGDAAVKLKSSTSQSYTASFASGAVNVAIPDGPTIPPVPASYPATSSNITVSGIPAGATVTGLRARMNITHAWVADLIIALKAPNGNVYNLDALLSGTNNPGANFTNTIISSSGTTALSAGAAPWSATFRADGAGATFVALGFTFPGGPAGFVPNVANWSGLYSVPNGTWTIAMYDAGAPDGGTFNNWTLDIDYVLGVPASPATWSPAGGLFSDAGATIPYVAGTQVDSVWTKPTPAGVYNYNVTVQSLSAPPAAVTTPMAGGNGNNMIFFNLTNGNGIPMNLNGLSSNSWASGAVTARLWVKTSPIAGNPGMIDPANGWNIIATQNSNVTANTLNAVLTGLAFPIPAGATYGIGLEFTAASATFPAYTNGAGLVTYSNNGCTITTGGNVGWGGPVAPGPPANNPRNFNGAVYLSAANVPACTSPARVVTVTVNTQPTVTIQPVNQTICTDKVATFSVTATIPLGTIAYQWEVSTNNGNTYTAVSNNTIYSGATTPTLTITRPPVSMSGYFYRCRLQGPAPCTPAYSFFRILTVNPLPTVVISASPYVKLFPGLRTVLSSTVSPFAAATYTWRRNGTVVGGAGTGTLNVDVDGLGDYTLTVTDVNGCTNTSNLINISDSVMSNCFLYPNPSNGQFQVRYYSVNNNSVLPRILTVYDARGARLFSQNFGITAPYARMDLDLRRYGHGVYWVELGDRNGARIIVCRAVVE